MYPKGQSKIIVMVKDGVSYIKFEGNYSFNPDNYRVNGEKVEVAPGNKYYGMYKGDVTIIERKRTPSRKVIGYSLYERYREITQLPHELPVDAFTRDSDGDLCGENEEFYREVYDNPEPYYELLDFEIVDRNSEPVLMPPYVVVEFPNDIGRYPEVQHNYPCYIRAGIVFNLLYDKITEKVRESDGKYMMDDYRNIQALRVSEVIKIPNGVRNKSVTVFEIYGPEYTISGKQPIPRTQIIRGNNYAELQANLESYIQSFISKLTEGKRCVCDKCRGEGIVNL